MQLPEAATFSRGTSALSSKLAPFEYEHSPRLNLVPLACCRISFEVVWERLFELKRDSAAHHTDAVDGVDEGFSSCFEDVPLFEFNHVEAPLVRIIPVPSSLYRRAVSHAGKRLIDTVSNRIRIDADPPHQLPRETLFDQELGLLPLFNGRGNSATLPRWIA